MAEQLFVCRSKEAVTYIQERMGSLARWGPRKTAMEMPEAWWRENIDADALRTCDLIAVEPSEDRKVSAYERLRKPAY